MLGKSPIRPIGLRDPDTPLSRTCSTQASSSTRFSKFLRHLDHSRHRLLRPPTPRRQGEAVEILNEYHADIGEARYGIIPERHDYASMEITRTQRPCCERIRWPRAHP